MPWFLYRVLIDDLTQAHAASLSDEPFVLEPIAVVPRSRLPFSWLEPPSALSPIQPGSLFVADIPVLEPGSPHDPTVLAVRLLSDGGIYVVERVKAGIYALSKLARDVEEGDIFVAVKGWNRCSVEEEAALPAAQDVADWWELARVEDPVLEPEFSKRAKVDVSVVFGVAGLVNDDGADARMKDLSPRESTESRAQSLAPRLPAERSSSSEGQTAAQMLGSIDAVVAETVDGEANRPDALQSPQELLDNLREQYLQALYVSKVGSFSLLMCCC